MNNIKSKLNSYSLGRLIEAEGRPTNTKLCPHWVSGFSDAESSFSVRITRDKNRKAGWRISPVFTIELNNRDIILLKRIWAFFGVGSFTERKNGKVVYYVQSFANLTEVIIPHFNKYPLLTKKRADFILFTYIIKLLNTKEQATMVGLQKIIDIRASMNKGLSSHLKIVFPNANPIARPIIDFEGIPHPNWLVGFIDGEGCFYVATKKNKSKLGIRVAMAFTISQHSRDYLLMSKIISYLSCGNVERPKGRSEVRFVVYKFNDIWVKILPLFKKYPLQGVKKADFLDFNEIAKLIENKSHLNPEGLKKICLLKTGMNKGRVHLR